MAGKPGRSGRRRQGAEPKVYFNSRMDPALRDQLQAAAKKNRQTLSREIELRLRSTFKPSTPSSDASRVFAFLFEEAARLTTVGDKNWQNDENLYLAFWAAVQELLRIALVRKTRWRPRKEWDEIGHPLFKRPDDLGKAAVFQITNSLANADSLDAVADLPPDDPRREYANAAQFVGGAKRWAADYMRTAELQAKLEGDPEYQALMREQYDLSAVTNDQLRAEEAKRLAGDWLRRLLEVRDKYREGK